MDKSKLQTPKRFTLRTPKGFRDFLPAEARKRQYVIKKIIEVFEYYGFDPLETPTLEYQELLLGKYGEEADRLVFKFEDAGKRKVALRYDQTVPVSRVLAQYQNEIPLPFKRYQIQPAFRAEKPQKGRYREFLQCDVDIFGASAPLPDAEILAIASAVFKNLGVDNLTININDRQELFKTLEKAGISQTKQLRATQIIDKLDKKDKDRVIKELAEAVGKSEAQSTFRLLDKQTKPDQSLAQIVKYATKLGVPKDQLNYVPYLARGLDYYTGLIVEVLIPGYKVGSVLGGGRFDKLIGQLSQGKVNLEAVGYSIGIDRTVEALDTLNLLPKQPSSAKILVTIFDKNLAKNSIALAAVLRDNGISTDLYPSLSVKLDKQLKYADKKSIPFVAIIGEQEAKDKTITLKDMASGKQQTISLDKLLPLLRS